MIVWLYWCLIECINHMWRAPLRGERHWCGAAPPEILTFLCYMIYIFYDIFISFKYPSYNRRRNAINNFMFKCLQLSYYYRYQENYCNCSSCSYCNLLIKKTTYVKRINKILFTVHVFEHSVYVCMWSFMYQYI